MVFLIPSRPASVVLLAYSLSVTLYLLSRSGGRAADPFPSPSSPPARPYTRFSSQIEDYWESPAYAPVHPRLAAAFVDRPPKTHLDWNARSMRDLYACMAAGNCGENQEKVVLCSSHWFAEAATEGFRGGEGVWGISMHKAMRELGYTTIFSWSWDETILQYQSMPDMVLVVIDHDIHECFAKEGCIKTSSHPHGIPAWKFDMSFFPGDRANWLSKHWTITADVLDSEEQRSTWIPYSLEQDCGPVPLIDLKDRKNQVWVLAKEAAYIAKPSAPFKSSFWNAAKGDPRTKDLVFRGAWGSNVWLWLSSWGEMPPITGIEHAGKLNGTAFMREVQHSAALVGIGEPFMSPSPYLALCVGTPFINPIISWSFDDPDNRELWNSQHPRLRWLDPPHVYNVRAGDLDGLTEALHLASTTPIDKFLLPEMRLDNVRDVMHDFLETDRRLLAEEQRRVRELEGSETIKDWIM